MLLDKKINDDSFHERKLILLQLIKETFEDNFRFEPNLSLDKVVFH